MVGWSHAAWRSWIFLCSLRSFILRERWGSSQFSWFRRLRLGRAAGMHQRWGRCARHRFRRLISSLRRSSSARRLHMQRDRTSRQGSPAVARPLRPKCNGRRRHQPCRSPNERRRRSRTTDEAYTEAPTNGPMGVREPRCITTFVRIAPSAAKRRASFIRGPATPTSRAADEAGISQPTWSSVGGKLKCANGSTNYWTRNGGISYVHM